MADVALLSASAGLTICISRHVGKDLSSKLPSLKISLGISLALFSLSFLEASPSSWLFLLDHGTSSDLHNRRGRFLVTSAYRLLLWMLCLWIVVVLPSRGGARLLAAMVERKLDPEQKYPTDYPWQLRYATRILLAVPLLAFRIVLVLFRRLRRNMGRRVLQAEPVLVMTHTSEGSRHGPSPTSGRNMVHIRPKNYSKWHIMTIGACFGTVSTMAILWSLGGFVMQSSSDKLQMLPTLVSWLCAVGLLLSSVLNGFGSVSLPHSCLAGIYLEPIGPEVIAKAQVELHKASLALASKHTELTSDMSSSTDIASMGRTFCTGHTNYGEEAVQRRHKVQQEIDFLETLVEELAEDVEEMKYAKVTAELARSPMGKIRSWLGVVFSIVLLVRLYTSFTSIWYGFNSPTTRRGDPITTALLWLTGHHLVSQADYNSLSQCVSLILTAFLSVSQVRTFVRTMSALNLRLLRFYRKCYCKSTSHTEEMSFKGTQIYTDLLAALMGCYFLSCVVLTKMNLPLEYRAGFSAAMGGTDFVVQNKVANSVFCASAAISATVLSLLFGIQRQNTKRHNADDTIGNLDAC